MVSTRPGVDGGGGDRMTCHRCKKNNADVMVPVRTADGKTVEQIGLCLACGWEMLREVQENDYKKRTP